MMSMPLKFSRSFSSKMGWPCTASSYGPGGAVAVARIGIPRRWGGIGGVVIRNLAVPDHHMVAQHTTHRLGEAAPDAFVGGDVELLPRFFGAPGPDLDEAFSAKCSAHAAA